MQMREQQRFDLMQHRGAVASAQPLSALRRPVLGQGLRAVELGNQPDEPGGKLVRRPRCLRDRFFGLDEGPRRMAPASKMRQAVRHGNAVVDLVAIAHEHGTLAHSGIKLLGMHATSPRRIGE